MVPLFRRTHLALTPDVSTLQRKNLRLLIKSAYDNINSFEYPLKAVLTPLLFLVVVPLRLDAAVSS